MFMVRLLLVTFFLALSACSGGSFDTSSSSRGSNNPEPPYYGTPRSISDGLTIQATAKFLYRPLVFNPSSESGGLGAPIAESEALAIPFAEFHIYDQHNNRIQQGETDTNGLIQTQIPKTVGTYTLKVFSRAFNNYLKVSVLDNLTDFAPHYVAQTFQVNAANLNSPVALPPLYAQADEARSSRVEGGAFNIYYNILLANEYIRRNIHKNNAAEMHNPLEWWVADKVQVFWTSGFNPYSYFGYHSNGMSFYSPGERRLYILGGMLGNISSADTDHFDDSVILHEYGHFLEDAYGNSQSPGGSHDGRSTIDPRLAWSEGFANYLQAAILTGAEANPANANEARIPQNKKFHYYVDTYGHSGSSQSGIGIAFNLLAPNNDQYDNVASEIEGNGSFREIAIARMLYKITRDSDATFNTDLSGGGILFSDFWKVFSGEDKNGHTAQNPLRDSLRNTTDHPVSHAELFHELLNKTTATSQAYSQIVDYEKQRTLVQDYGQILNRSSNACAYTFNGALRDAVRSHQQRNNDFYLYYHDGSNSTLSLVSNSGDPDLDLIIYEKFYVYFEDVNWVNGKSSAYIVRESRSQNSEESVSLRGLSRGYYMINVKASMYRKENSSSTNTYYLKLGSQFLCP